MGVAKKLLKPRVIVWAATTVLLGGVLIAGNIVATQTLPSLLDGVFGGKRPVVAPGDSGIPFIQDFDTKAEALENGNKVTEEICEEGMILLKNNNALPLAKNAKVSVFGKNSTNFTRMEGLEKVTVGLVYGGSGSAAPGDGERKTIYNSLSDAGFSYNPKLKEFYESDASGKGRSSNPAMEHGEGIPTLSTGETAYSSYSNDLKASYDQYGDAALVVISRIAGENWDLPRKADDNPARHYLELDENERTLIRELGKSGKFKHIIILLNGSNYVDVGFLEERTNATDYNDFGKYVDGCINIGSPGANGIMALGRILSGEVNPSGHTVDTVYTNYKNDPTWQNFGGNFTDGGDNYLNEDGSATSYYLVEYEENIYVGYRYYETRGAIEGEEWYNKNVVYPFGYGLSYTSFEQEITNVSALEGEALEYGKTFEVSIKVKNTGNVAGKQVVQLYAQAPYKAGGIEKAHKVLVGFAKTKLLEKNREETVKITVNPYDFASFNSDSTNGGYILEAGDYIFHAGTDAHHDFATFTKHLGADVKITNDPVTGTEVKPLFPEVTEHMHASNMQALSRSNFAGTFPQPITDAERKINSEFLKKLKSKASTNPEEYDEVPLMGVDKGVGFKELVNLEYDDPKWDEFLDQMEFDEMLTLFNEGCYRTIDIERLGIPLTTSADGPTGLVQFLGAGDTSSVYGTCYYQSECLLAQTYNLELADKQGNAIGNEALIGNEKGGGLAYPGWYAPGVNIHRSPFSGRNTEYYSEDSFLNGKFGGRVIKSVQEKGVYANIKHYALNDQETHRSANGIATWCDEQAMREIYLKAFEIAVKEGKSLGLMTSFNRIGTEWAGGSYRLVTTILRKEWGFVGSVICDFHTDFYMDSKQMLYAGGDINMVSLNDRKLTTDKKYGTPIVSPEDPKDTNLLRKSAHNNLFAIVNSNAMKADILYYKPAIWRVMLYTADGVIGGGLAVWGFFAIFTALRKKEAIAAAAE